MQPQNDYLTEVVRQLKREIVEVFQMQEKPVTIEKAAEHLTVSIQHLRRMISSGQLPKKYVHRFGGSYRFYISELNEYIKSPIKISK